MRQAVPTWNLAGGQIPMYDQRFIVKDVLKDLPQTILNSVLGQSRT